MKAGALALGLALAAAIPARAEMVVRTSPHSVAETIDRLEAAAKARSFLIVARVDHAANAKRVGLSLRPMQLLIFGNPTAGTKLIEAAPTMGLSLPLKMLAWQEPDGSTRLAFDRAADLGATRGMATNLPLLQTVDETMAALGDAAVDR